MSTQISHVDMSSLQTDAQQPQQRMQIKPSYVNKMNVCVRVPNLSNNNKTNALQILTKSSQTNAI